MPRRATWARLFAPIAVALMVPGPAAAQGAAAAAADLQRARQLANSAYLMYEEDARGDTLAFGVSGVLVAEGDSWFDYPRWDVLKALRRDGYEVISAAHYGQTLEEIAYSPAQFTGTIDALKRVRAERKPLKAILLSAGGNDLAGPELSVILSYKGAGGDVVDTAVLGRIIDVRLRQAMKTWLLAVSEASIREFGRKVPILIHGYDYPVPDGRGFLGGFWLLPGPWLDPAFRNRAYAGAPSGVDANTGPMHEVIDRFNAMVSSLPSDPDLPNVRYVRLTGTLSAEPGQYTKDWANELHPSPDGFKRVAKRFEQVLSALH